MKNGLVVAENRRVSNAPYGSCSALRDPLSTIPFATCSQVIASASELANYMLQGPFKHPKWCLG